MLKSMDKNKNKSYFYIADRWVPFSRYYLFNNALELPSGFIVSQSAPGLSSSLNKLTANANSVSIRNDLMYITVQGQQSWASSYRKCSYRIRPGKVGFNMTRKYSKTCVKRPLKNHKNMGFLSNTGPDLLRNRAATKLVFNFGHSSARQRNAILMAFRWWVDDGPL